MCPSHQSGFQKSEVYLWGKAALSLFEKEKGNILHRWLSQGETVVYTGHEEVFFPEFDNISPQILPTQVFHSQLGGRGSDDPSCPPGVLRDSSCLGVKLQRNFLDFFFLFPPK